MPLTFALQALLVRHEAYVADSERERKQMIATIEKLEQEKLDLEAKNAQTIKANRDLLDRLEHLNDAVASSDAHIQALSDTLRSTEDEIERLSALAARTQLLEQQLMDLEKEQLQLQSNLDAKLVDERTAIQRWKTAERTIGDLQDQIDRIEKEAREERERHVEVVARMERRMAVEGELNTAAGRLKAKAGHEKAGTNVVSHFVKDILLDNANLQHGILELREMLLNSNEEVERLRDQLKVHQPVSSGGEELTQ
jgi:chromosome segregation ATPase